MRRTIVALVAVAMLMLMTVPSVGALYVSAKADADCRLNSVDGEGNRYWGIRGYAYAYARADSWDFFYELEAVADATTGTLDEEESVWPGPSSVEAESGGAWHDFGYPTAQPVSAEAFAKASNWELPDLTAEEDWDGSRSSLVPGESKEAHRVDETNCGIKTSALNLCDVPLLCTE